MEKFRQWIKKKEQGHPKEIIVEGVKQSWEVGPLHVKEYYLEYSELSDFHLSELADPAAFEERYPDLAAYFKQPLPRPASEVAVAQLTISSYRDTEQGYRPYTEGGKPIWVAGVELARDVESSLYELAQDMKRTGRFRDSRYFIGLSRLGVAGKRFGFDTFEVLGERAVDTDSHEWARSSYQAAGISAEEAAKTVNKQPAVLTVMPMQTFLEKFSTRD